MNFFRPRSAAERYVKGRPHFHPAIVGRIKEFFALDAPLPRALDVGCGTGLSTLALKELAAEVVGIDLSPEMIARAPKAHGIRYIVSPAENLPFAAHEFDLITLSQVFHWLDRERFFAEARRILRAAAPLVVYDNYFASEADESAEFQTWLRGAYLREFPAPLRRWTEIGAEDAEREGFRLLRHERYQNKIRFSLEELVNYLVSQSNVIAAVEVGGRDIEEVRNWLTENIKPLFGNIEAANFLFNAPIWYLQRAT
jgi:SAM-dependent methyltransferase